MAYVTPEATEGSRPSKGLVGRFRPSGFFILRTPLLPVAEFAKWTAGAAARGRADDARDHLRESLTRRLTLRHTADALRVASPSLVGRLNEWLHRRPTRRKERLERTLVQYFARMCDRCTPFGLFAGVSVGEIGKETRLRIAGRERYRRRSALDLAQVFRLVSRLLEDESVRARLRYRTNDSLAGLPGGYQYIEALGSDARVRHRVAFLEADPALDAAVERAEHGATLSELQAAISSAITDPEVNDSDIAEYLDDLIEAQVIEPTLIPAVVGPDPLDQILASLEDVAPLTERTTQMRRLRADLDRLDSHGVGAPKESYAAVGAVWSRDLGLSETDRLLQVDMFKEAAGLRLSEAVVEEVMQGAETLWRLTRQIHDPMRDLKRRFRERYEAREVPLAEVFDPRMGLGVPGPGLGRTTPRPPLLAGLDLAAPRAGPARDAGTGFSEVLANRVFELRAEFPAILELDDGLLDLMKAGEPGKLPDALAIHLDLLADSEKAVQRGEFRVVYHGAVGPSGARMLGRFCDLDHEMLACVRRHVEEEAALDPDALFVEVVHTPEGRVGNVVRRPHLRDVELSVAGHSRRRDGRRLTLDDLLVSLVGGRFRLRSRRDGRVVRPRLTSAHNFRRSSGVYRFLCALQSDGIQPAFGWNWGALATLSFLPRVTRGRAIYALARWKVGRERLGYAAIGKAKGKRARRRATERLAAELGLPRFVRLADGDNRLLLDLENPLCLAVLADHASRRPQLTLVETLADDLEGCVRGPEGKYRNEIILPLVRKHPEASRGNDSRTSDGAPMVPLTRVFPPCSEWLYFRIYCASTEVDHLLRELVVPLVGIHRKMFTRGTWFFIRYADPEPHVRLRLRVGSDARREMEDRAAALLQPCVDQGSVHRWSLDTYVREVERYGGARGIELAEDWFRWDSDAALEVIGIVEESADEDLRWRAALMGTDRLLADFGLDLGERQRLAAKAREAYGKEFGVRAPVRRRLARRLRRERATVEAVVTGSVGSGPLAEVEAVFRRRSVRAARTVSKIRELDETGGLTVSLDDLLRSLAHMHANRLLPVSARAQELVIHDFLSRTYRSLLARQRR